MELFSELYGCYYFVTSQILKNSPLTENEMNQLIHSKGFSESALYLAPKLYKSDGWGLLTRDKDTYSSRLIYKPKTPLTLLEKRWLKALLQDKRMQLFLEEDAFKVLSEKLGQVEPLFHSQHFKYFDIFTDGDDYENPDYIKHFRQLINALHKKEVQSIIYQSGKGRIIEGDYLPYRLEYSPKNDKFRVFVARIKNRKAVGFGTINLSRILHMKALKLRYTKPLDLEEIFKWKRCTEPLTLEITRERNAIERFMMEFAHYEKSTIWDQEHQTCSATIWYDTQDESELLIKLLSFGPVLKVTGPARVVEQIRDRVNRQYELLYPN